MTGEGRKLPGAVATLATAGGSGGSRGGGDCWRQRRRQRWWSPLFFFFPCVFCSVVFFFCFCYLPLFLCSALLVAMERKSNGGAAGLKVADGGSSSSPLLLLPWFSFSRLCSVSLLPLWFCWRWQHWWWQNGGAGWWWPNGCAHSGWRCQTAVLPFLCSVFFLCFFSFPFLSPAPLSLLPLSFSWKMAQGGVAAGRLGGTVEAAMRTTAGGSSSPLLCSVSLFSVFKCSPSFLLSKPSPPLFFISPVFIGSRGRGTIPCPSAGHGGVGWLLCSRCRAWPSFRHGGGAWVSCFFINEGMGCVSS